MMTNPQHAATRCEPSGYLIPGPGAPRLFAYVPAIFTPRDGLLATWRASRVLRSVWGALA